MESSDFSLGNKVFSFKVLVIELDLGSNCKGSVGPGVGSSRTATLRLNPTFDTVFISSVIALQIQALNSNQDSRAVGYDILPFQGVAQQIHPFSDTIGSFSRP